MAIKVHGALFSTCTARVLICLCEKGLDYELLPIDMVAGAHKQQPFRSLNVRTPLKSFPVFWLLNLIFSLGLLIISVAVAMFSESTFRKIIKENFLPFYFNFTFSHLAKYLLSKMVKLVFLVSF